MKFIIEFYKGLDALSLIIFWGVVLVVLLLLFFSILLINKNKKLKEKVNNKSQEKDDFIPIVKKQFEETLEEIKKEKNQEDKKSIILPNEEFMVEKETSIKEEKKIENKEDENIMEYNKDLFALTNIKKNNVQKEAPTKNIPDTKTDFTLPNKPYQRNVLREISSNQTSPIGIVRDVKKEERTMNEAKELHDSLSEDSLFEEKSVDEAIFEIDIEKEKNKDIQENNSHQHEGVKTNYTKNTEEKINQAKEVRAEIERKRLAEKRKERYYENLEKSEIKIDQSSNEEKKENLIIKKQPVEEQLERKEIPTRVTEEKNESRTPIQQKKESNKDYLEEVSKKLSEATQPDDIDRTEYELKQEEEAIISYEELMQKKDSIKMIDEEEAVISIEELMQRKKQEEKLYNITEQENNDDFLKELKNFRNDL